MKRQRTHNDVDDAIPNLSFKDVCRFLQDNTTLTCEELLFLSQEINGIYSTRVNRLTQNFPSDVLLQIFTEAQKRTLEKWPTLLPPVRLKDFKFWLVLRTVSRSWCSTIDKIDFSVWCPTSVDSLGNAARLLSKFKFSTVRLRSTAVDFALMTNVKTLSFGTSIYATPELCAPISQLTQLTTLFATGASLPQESLHCLTNLQGLTLADAPQITSLDPLTNLQNLILHEGSKIKTLTTLTNLQSLTVHDTTPPQSGIKGLSRLTHLVSHDPEFFRSGRGICHFEGHIYEGDFSEGTYHGHGLLRYRDHDEYEGQWVNDREHGKGVLRFWNTELKCHDGTYTGDWDDGLRTGKGIRVYRNKDTYEGDWVDGFRTGHGIYKCHADGAVYDGAWQQGWNTGRGKCTYANGDTYEGDWERGKRHGQGVYIFHELGDFPIEGQWTNNKYMWGLTGSSGPEMDLDERFCKQFEKADSESEEEDEEPESSSSSSSSS